MLFTTRATIGVLTISHLWRISPPATMGASQSGRDGALIGLIIFRLLCEAKPHECLFCGKCFATIHSLGVHLDISLILILARLNVLFCRRMLLNAVCGGLQLVVVAHDRPDGKCPACILRAVVVSL